MSIDADRFRAVLGHFPSGVTIVTGIAKGEPVGFTCQSFSSLSLDPPLVVLLPSLSSTSWPRIADTGRFCINVLAEHQGGLSTRFARSGSDKFSGVAWTTSSTGVPVLEGACASIDCEIEQVHPGGDHLVVIAAVVDLAADSARGPLLFHRGRYARRADVHEA
ncbi:flavin reductase family protein [Actinomycetospora termitidis]|uniref:Flavin reductase family protein n=1 Tax=Actinomycetospora termitidis TaxID=3053470 RepID=A0ABT7M621_9PSEU|nr:flavin reductase family protein [Actinomycetospora sp. Odt1-22]MDL5156113.1 flavin reductase family protein [Actinomycetospora sp. Odt1-22]